jgi:hypothetical protein
MTMLGIPQRTNGQSGNYQSSTCSAPNDYTQPVFYAWQSYNGTSYMINYKFSSVSPYAFRKSAPEAVGESSSLWQLFPNPAADVLTLQNPGAANEQSGYVISDITGRIAINGQINGCTGTVNIAMLAPGTYVLKIINDGDEQSPLLFVKN